MYPAYSHKLIGLMLSRSCPFAKMINKIKTSANVLFQVRVNVNRFQYLPMIAFPRVPQLSSSL